MLKTTALILALGTTVAQAQSFEESNTDLVRSTAGHMAIAQTCGYGFTPEYTAFYAVVFNLTADMDAFEFTQIVREVRLAESAKYAEHGPMNYCLGSLLSVAMTYDMEVFIVPEGS